MHVNRKLIKPLNKTYFQLNRRIELFGMTLDDEVLSVVSYNAVADTVAVKVMSGSATGVVLEVKQNDISPLNVVTMKAKLKFVFNDSRKPFSALPTPSTTLEILDKTATEALLFISQGARGNKAKFLVCNVPALNIARQRPSYQLLEDTTVTPHEWLDGTRVVLPRRTPVYNLATPASGFGFYANVAHFDGVEYFLKLPEGAIVGDIEY